MQRKEEEEEKIMNVKVRWLYVKRCSQHEEKKKKKKRE
jgi:hypothetical protein